MARGRGLEHGNANSCQRLSRSFRRKLVSGSIHITKNPTHMGVDQYSVRPPASTMSSFSHIQLSYLRGFPMVVHMYLPPNQHGSSQDPFGRLGSMYRIGAVTLVWRSSNDRPMYRTPPSKLPLPPARRSQREPHTRVRVKMKPPGDRRLWSMFPLSAPTGSPTHGCGSKTGTQNETLVNGTNRTKTRVTPLFHFDPYPHRDHQRKSFRQARGSWSCCWTPPCAAAKASASWARRRSGDGCGSKLNR